MKGLPLDLWMQILFVEEILSYFWNCFHVLFFLSCQQAFEDVYLDSRPTLKEVLRVLNIFFAVVFVLEFLLKLIGLGFTSYFSSAWNWLDVAIIAVSDVPSLPRLYYLREFTFDCSMVPPTSLWVRATSQMNVLTRISFYRSLIFYWEIYEYHFTARDV